MSGERDYLVDLDVDCGELLPGRRLVLRGLREEGSWPDAAGNRPPEGVDGSWRMVSLEYEVVPGISEGDPDGPAWHGHEIASVEFHPDVPRAWRHGDGQGWLSIPPGQPAARGAWGPYPLPEQARVLTFAVFANLDVRPGEGDSVLVRRADEPVGRLVVDLTTGGARWEPVAAPA